MSRQRRSFSVEQKLQILSEADQTGITQTLRKQNLSHSLFLRWKKQFNGGGVGSLQPPHHKVDPELKALQQENARLKRLLETRLRSQNLRPSFLKKRCPREEAEEIISCMRRKG